LTALSNLILLLSLLLLLLLHLEGLDLVCLLRDTLIKADEVGIMVPVAAEEGTMAKDVIMALLVVHHLRLLPSLEKKGALKIAQ